MMRNVHMYVQWVYIYIYIPCRTSFPASVGLPQARANYVCDSVLRSLVSSLFLFCLRLWEYLQGTQLYFFDCWYIGFCDQHTKGKEKYANVYLTWLNYISSISNFQITTITEYTMYIIPTANKLYVCYSTSDTTNCYCLYTAQCRRRHATTNGGWNWDSWSRASIIRGDTALYCISW